MQVSQKIKNVSTKLGIPFNKAADIYALERIVARINADTLLGEALTFGVFVCETKVVGNTRILSKAAKVSLFFI